MIEKRTVGQSHAAASDHHEQAAQYHREASIYYREGKDHAHAAHQALLANGHTLLALEHGNEASKYYAKHPSVPASVETDFGPDVDAKDNIQPIQADLNAAEHHAAAAAHHQEAVRHHNQASKHNDEKQMELAARHAQMAHRHAHYSVFHGNEAAMHHVEHYGKSRPTAEIV